LFALSGFAADSGAQELYGAVSGADSPLYIIDPMTGAATAVGNIGFGITGLAFHPITGELYGTQGGVPDDVFDRNLIRIDPTTGAGTVVGPIGLGFGGVADIAFREDGTLFGWSESSDDLITIDLTTGAGTIVGNAGISTRGSGLAFNRDGTLYLAGNNGNGPLRTVNTTTGLTTAGPILTGAPFPTMPIPAMKFHPVTDELLAVNRQTEGLGGPTWLIKINPATGVITTVGTTVDRLDALAWSVRGQKTYFLSEGATDPDFDAYLLLANPNDAPAPATIEFLKPEGAPVVQNMTIAPLSRATIAINDVPELDATAFATEVTSTDGLPLVVERSMYVKPDFAGGHSGRATSPSTTWYFAEGAAGQQAAGERAFTTYLALANPNTATAMATVAFVTETGTTIERTYVVGAMSRTTISSESVPELQVVGQSFGIIVVADLPIVAERAQYLGSDLRIAHESEGVAQTDTTWHHADGASGDFFDTFLLLLNPNATAATVTCTYRTAGGATVVRTHAIPPRSRLTVLVDAEGPQLAQAEFWTTVTSDVPIVSERSMYWAGNVSEWREAHNSPGLTQAAVRWGLAEGAVGGPLEFQTFLLVANPDVNPAIVEAQFLPADGTTVAKSFTVPALGRVTLWLNQDVPELSDESFGAIVQSQNDVPILLERSMYWTVGGESFGGGTNSPGTPIP
jgi:hypothetical protein